MGTQDLLQYEIVLLLAKYGEKQVLKALADHLGVTHEALEASLKAIHTLVPRVTKKKRPDPQTTIDSLVTQHPDKAEYLRILLSRFQNRTFLSEFKDVKQFFHRRGSDLGKVKARAAVVPKLFKLLATLDTKELTILCEDVRTGDYSSLGILADEIMKSEKK
jgi:hypothetical protein